MRGLTLGQLRAELDRWVRKGMSDLSVVKFRLGSDLCEAVELRRGRNKNVEVVIKEAATQEPPPTIAEIEAMALIIREQRPVVAHSIHDTPPLVVPFVNMNEHSVMDEEKEAV